MSSPTIALPTGTLTLSFSWYLAHLNNASSADFFRVSVVVGTTATTVFNQNGAASNRAGAWGTASVNISGFAGQTVRLRVEAADAATASLIEAGVDNVTITRA
jgi:aminopeptidase S